jgi:hypothetical protein
MWGFTPPPRLLDDMDDDNKGDGLSPTQQEWNVMGKKG